MTMKRYVMPAFWPVHRKENVYVTSPRAGPHSRYNCISLQVVVRDVLKLADTGNEAKKILAAGNVIVDKRERKDCRYPVGMQDVVEIPETGKQFRVDVNEKGLFMVPISADETDRKLCRINGKCAVKGGMIQLNMHDGRNITLKSAKDYRVGDSVLLSLPEQAVIKHFPLKEGEEAIIVAGKNRGIRGKIKVINRKARMQDNSTVTVLAGNKEIQTLMDYVMVGKVTKDSVPKKEPSRKERMKGSEGKAVKKEKAAVKTDAAKAERKTKAKKAAGEGA